ncbi:hypothetical protein OH492_02185 [Vibrio chagasii]|nr:hypothetical protein [Vibrio chagasii]
MEHTCIPAHAATLARMRAPELQKPCYPALLHKVHSHRLSPRRQLRCCSTVENLLAFNFACW